MDDYLLGAILLNSHAWKALEINQGVIEEGRQCKDAKSVVRHLMKIGDEETRMLIKDSILPDSLTQIIDAIAGDKIEKP
jgi:hypothetical protein